MYRIYMEIYSQNLAVMYRSRWFMELAPASQPLTWIFQVTIPPKINSSVLMMAQKPVGQNKWQNSLQKCEETQF